MHSSFRSNYFDINDDSALNQFKLPLSPNMLNEQFLLNMNYFIITVWQNQI